MTIIDEPAACSNHPHPEWWFPDNVTKAEAAYLMAQPVCMACPRLTVCRQGALDRGEPDGMWGGLSPDQRRDVLAGREPGKLVRRKPRKPREPGVNKRPKALTIEQQAEVIRRYEHWGDAGELALEFNVSRPTIYRVISANRPPGSRHAPGPAPTMPTESPGDVATSPGPATPAQGGSPDAP